MDAPSDQTSQTSKSETDYKATLQLPKTAFPMKADLAKREPEMLARWAGESLYERILEARKDDPPWVFHDGPPYANGHIHYGHILNKLLKDIVVKSRTMMGRYVEFKPGWDTHGLPIELAVLRDFGDKAQSLSPVEIRRACHDFAMKWVDTQRAEFQRLGVFGTWDRPYLTLDPGYEATIIRQLAGFARKGLLYRDKKPVHWCMSCKTALAEAEIEYDDNHVSPSIYVKFALPEAGLFAVIWTTTPWTLPANYAIAYQPTFEYVTVAARGERYIVAKELADAFVAACGLVEEGPREAFEVTRFAALKAARHPFLDRESLLVPADYVTKEQGTGLVHTAPGHGADDFATGKKYDLPIEAPVGDNGVFTDGPWAGEHVFKANPKIVAHLQSSGALLSPPSLTVKHSYPNCWRCKNPVIFRGTEQWFAKLDSSVGGGTTLRKRALSEIDATTWIPGWGINRIRGMIENRPDWVLSRQRAWGVPIPVFFDEGGVYPAMPGEMARAMEHVAELVEKEGVDAWFSRPPEELLPPDLVRPGLEKGADIVDVWFESGVSWAAVCEGKPGLDSSDETDNGRRGIPVDLYLEGSDQHRGWFHSSLLAASATRGHAPYRTVLTHGFVLDERGRPYSKSEIEKARKAGIKIEFIPPEEVLKTQGAELFRFWAASSDFRNDIAYSRGHLTQLGESYRKLRNTARFLLGNLDGFDPAQHGALPELHEKGALALDGFVLSRVREVEMRVRAAYESYELHVVVKTLLDLCITDLSALYLDVRKDRLYCDPAGAPARRATQAVIYEAARALALMLAPIACFTAEEIWQHLPRLPDDPSSVHLAVWPARFAPEDEVGEPLAKRWAILLDLRKLVQAKLEPFRAAKHASLDARVTLTLPPDARAAAEELGPDALADLFIVSQVVIEGGESIDARVDEAPGHRCERCWKYTNEAPPLCARCRAAVSA